MGALWGGQTNGEVPLRLSKQEHLFNKSVRRFGKIRPKREVPEPHSPPGQVKHRRRKHHLRSKGLRPSLGAEG